MVVCSMDFHASIPEWYGLVVILMTAIWQTFRFTHWLFRRCVSPLVLYCTRRLAATSVRLWPRVTISEYEVIFVLSYVAANTVCMCLRLKNHAEVAARSGILATINLVPLLVGTHLGDMADFLGVTLHMSKILHRWIGWVTLLEGAIHVLLVALNVNIQWSPLQIWGIIVSQHVLASIHELEANLNILLVH